jgi:hypothetical protein
MRKIWNDSDVLYNIDDLAKCLDELLNLIDLKLANTSEYRIFVAGPAARQ